MTDRILIVEGRFYDHISDELLAGAKAALEAAGAKYDVVTVPGALEIPAVIAIAENARAGYDGYVALGVVIRGETYHFEVVSDESARGIMNLANTGLAIGNGVLTVENEAQALTRAKLSEGDKGGGAVRACLAVLGVKQRLTKSRS